MKSGTVQSKSADFRLRVFKQRFGSLCGISFFLSSFLSEVAPVARSISYLLVSHFGLCSDRRGAKNRVARLSVNKDLHHFSVCMLRAAGNWQSYLTHSSFSLLLSLSACTLFSLHPFPFLCNLLQDLAVKLTTTPPPMRSSIIRSPHCDWRCSVGLWETNIFRHLIGLFFSGFSTLSSSALDDTYSLPQMI